MRIQVTDDEASGIIRQILLGISHMHNLNIAHKDIKLRNILIERVQNDKIKAIISDLGLGIEYHDFEGQFNHFLSGTIEFMAPEQLFNGFKYTKVFFRVNLFVQIVRGYMGNWINCVYVINKKTPIIRFKGYC